jgi:hypothetical protein
MRTSLSVMFLFIAILCCTCRADEEARYQQHLAGIQGRMKVERNEHGDQGTIFKVWITPPQQPSFDAAKFEGLSEFARAVDVPCKRVQIGLNSYGPSGVRDLSMTLDLNRIETTGGIFLEFHLPQSHSGHEKGLPFLVLICSNIEGAGGKKIDWIPTPLALMKPSDLKGSKPTPQRR